MVRQTECLDYIRENPGCTTADLVDRFYPDHREWEKDSRQRMVACRCDQLLKVGFVRKIANKTGTWWWAI